MNVTPYLVLRSKVYCTSLSSFKIEDFTFEHINTVKDEDYDINKICKELIPNHNYNPISSDKLFFLPGCTVPRFKLRKMIEKYKFALVKTEDRANVKFISEDSIRALTNLESLYYGPKQQVINALTRVQINNNRINTSYNVELLRLSNYTHVCLNYYAYWSLVHCGGLNQSHFEVESTKFFVQDGYDKYVRWKNDPQIFHQKQILTYLNAGLMTRTEYDSISKLFESSDNSNHKIAMEMMANCDYEQSCLFLLLLIDKYGSKMDLLSNKNHVNFKALTKFFEIQNLSYFNERLMLDVLIKNKLLNQSNLDFLVKSMIDDFESDVIQDFGVITYTDAVYKALDENVLDYNKNVEVISTQPEELMLQL